MSHLLLNYSASHNWGPTFSFLWHYIGRTKFFNWVIWSWNRKVVWKSKTVKAYKVFSSFDVVHLERKKHYDYLYKFPVYIVLCRYKQSSVFLSCGFLG